MPYGPRPQFRPFAGEGHPPITVSDPAGESVGELDSAETREIGERVIDFYGFDTRLLIERRFASLQLAAVSAAGRAPTG